MTSLTEAFDALSFDALSVVDPKFQHGCDAFPAVAGNGFDLSLPRSTLPSSLEGEASLEYQPDGVVWSLIAPWDRIVAATDQAAAVQTGANDAPG